MPSRWSAPDLRTPTWSRTAASRSAYSSHRPRCRLCRFEEARALEIALALLQLHRAVLMVIDAAQLPFGMFGYGQLVDDFRNGGRRRPHGPGARRAAERPHAAHDALRFFAGHQRHERLLERDERVAAYDHFPFLGEVQRN